MAARRRPPRHLLQPRHNAMLFITAALLISCAHALPPNKPLGWRSLAPEDKGLYSYADFLREFPEKVSSPESRSIFEQNLAKIHAHNAKGLSWTEGVNQFTDMSPAEFARYKGKVFQPKADEPFNRFDTGVALGDLPPSIDWRTKGAVTPTKNQGGCGSCWAFSATESIESAVFMATGKLPVLSPQEFVDCIPNPNSCGGNGGCEGSTEEYGFAFAMIYGMANDSSYNYTADTGKECLLGKAGRDAVAGVSNFVHLPANDYTALMQAVATVGPISISVDASWGSYEKGVYKGCGNHTTIDHAVQLVGYGTDAGEDYFLVRNSWGATWGEGGYIRLPRTATGDQTCAEDMSPGSGNGCKGGPKEQKVCGACGMLSDSSFPTGGFLVDPSSPIPAPGQPIPPAGTKICGCQGDGECGQLGQHCCCYDAKKDDISCTATPVTKPSQCCGDPAKDCKKSADDADPPSWV